MNSAKIPFITGLLLFCISVQGQGFLKADGKQIVNGRDENIILRGIGLGGWMLQEGYMLGLSGGGQQHKIRERIEALISKEQTQEFYDTWLANHTRRIDIDSLHAWGFNSVRLPMHYALYTLPVDQEPVAGQQTWLEKGFAITDSLLSWCRDNKMYLILDMHAAPGGQGNDLNISDRDPSKPSLWQSEADRQKMIALWRKLAEHYANEPWIGGYDIINEPNWGFEDSLDKNGLKEKGNIPLRQLMIDITKAIREVDTHHLIIIEGNGWGNNYNGILPTWDNNMALSFHKYWNNNDLASIQHILDFRNKYNVPAWLGETGENSNTWFTDAVRLLEENNIGWAWWPLKKAGFNNPLQIRTNLNYNRLLDYWNGKTPKPPKESDVYSGLLEFATYTKLETNILHRDVIDAIIRQSFHPTAIPYHANKIASGTLLKAVDYDLGPNGVAYYDTDTANYRVSTQKNGVGNRGHVYRNDGVDIRKDSAEYESYYVSDIENDEWLQYTLGVNKAGVYDLVLNVASENKGSLSVRNGSNTVLATVAIPATGDRKNWQTVAVKGIRLAAGRQTLRLYAETGGYNLKSIVFKVR